MGTSIKMKYLITLTFTICLVQVYSNPLENKSSELLKECTEICKLDENTVKMFFQNPTDFNFINGVVSSELRSMKFDDVFILKNFRADMLTSIRKSELTEDKYWDDFEEYWKDLVKKEPEFKLMNYERGQCVCEE